MKSIKLLVVFCAALAVCCVGQDFGEDGEEVFEMGSFYLNGMKEEKKKANNFILYSADHTVVMKGMPKGDCETLRLKIDKMKSSDLAKKTVAITFRSEFEGDLKTMSNASHEAFWDVSKLRHAFIGNQDPYFHGERANACKHDLYDNTKILEDAMKVQGAMCDKDSCREYKNNLESTPATKNLDKIKPTKNIIFSFGYSLREETLRHVLVVKNNQNLDGLDEKKLLDVCDAELKKLLRGKLKIEKFYSFYHIPQYEVVEGVKKPKEKVKKLMKFLKGKGREIKHGDYYLGILQPHFQRLCPFTVSDN